MSVSMCARPGGYVQHPSYAGGDGGTLTSNISDAEDADSSSLDDTSLVGKQRGGTRSRDSLGRTTGSTVGEVAGVVKARGLLIRLRL